MQDSLMQMGAPDTSRRFKFIGCEVLYREACFLAATGPHRVDVEFLLKGLHDVSREDMLAKLQSAVDAASEDTGYEAILLGYARCNDGVVGLEARGAPLVIPRAHDCITFFFGSRAAYDAYFQQHPGTYFLTSGWSERNNFGEDGYARPAYGMEGVMGRLGLAESYEAMVAKYGQENADFLVESLGGWLKNYARCLYLEMGICQEEGCVAQAEDEARKRGWEFEVRAGDWNLLKKLFHAQWDDDFQIVPPGARLTARNDEAVLGVDTPPGAGTP